MGRETACVSVIRKFNVRGGGRVCARVFVVVGKPRKPWGWEGPQGGWASDENGTGEEPAPVKVGRSGFRNPSVGPGVTHRVVGVDRVDFGGTRDGSFI